MRKYHTGNGWVIEIGFLTVLESGSPGSRCCHYLFLLRTLFWLLDTYSLAVPLTWLFLVLQEKGRDRERKRDREIKIEKDRNRDRFFNVLVSYQIDTTPIKLRLY